jgi:hypothetical protein
MPAEEECTSSAKLEAGSPGWFWRTTEDSVSHQVMKSGAGNVNCCLRQGPGLSEHGPLRCPVQILDGEAQITIAGNPTPKEGDAG